MKNTIKFSNWILKRTDNLQDVLIISLITIIFVVILVIVTKKKRQLYRMSQSNHHNWNFNDLITVAHNCNICETNIVLSSGCFCDCCQLYIDEKCLKKADKEIKCKVLCRNNDSSTVWHHHWIKGNLPLNSICNYCKQICDITPGINDFKCVWCQNTIHEICLNKMNNKRLEASFECDFGVYKNFILKPNFIISNKMINNKFNSICDVKIDHELVEEMRDWTPLIVFANTKSGSNDADQIMKHFRSILNPLQVINMNNLNPKKVFKWMSNYSDIVQFNVLVCGGDGSVGWLLEIASKLKFKVNFFNFKNFILNKILFFLETSLFCYSTTWYRKRFVKSFRLGRRVHG